MGAYARVDSLFQYGRPVYQQESGSNYIFASGGNWLIGGDYTVGSGGVRSVEEGRIQINGLTWQFYSGGWQDDATLKVEGNGMHSKCPIVIYLCFS